VLPLGAFDTLDISESCLVIRRGIPTSAKFFKDKDLSLTCLKSDVARRTGFVIPSTGLISFFNLSYSSVSHYLLDI
jgi:hypothetical protein